jgi:hypothetical protein
MADRSGFQPYFEATAFQAVEYSHIGSSYEKRCPRAPYVPSRSSLRKAVGNSVN